MVETFKITAQSDQSVGSLLAFAKNFMLRGIAAGAVKEGNSVIIYMLPETAARYVKNVPSYEQDRNAVIEAIGSAGYKLQSDEPIATPEEKTISEKPVEELIPDADPAD